MGSNRDRNEVGIFTDEELVNLVIELRHKSDRMMTIKVVLRSEFLNVLSVYILKWVWLRIVRSRFRRIF